MNEAMLNKLEMILADAQKASISDSWVLALWTCIYIKQLRNRVFTPIKQSFLTLLNYYIRLPKVNKLKQFQLQQLSHKAEV